MPATTGEPSSADLVTDKTRALGWSAQMSIDRISVDARTKLDGPDLKINESEFARRAAKSTFHRDDFVCTTTNG